MESILNWVSQYGNWMHQYGYVAIFLLLVLGIAGLPIPDETMLAYAGYLVYKGELNLLPTILVAFVGTSCGITTSYLVGRTLGLQLIKRFGRYVRITEERLNRVHNWYERVGKWTLPFGYFVPGVRHLTALVAGSSKLDLPQFCLFAYSGGFVWSVTFVSLGYFLGDKGSHILAETHNILVGVGILAACILLFFLVRHRNRIWKNY